MWRLKDGVILFCSGKGSYRLLDLETKRAFAFIGPVVDRIVDLFLGSKRLSEDPLTKLLQTKGFIRKIEKFDEMIDGFILRRLQKMEKNYLWLLPSLEQTERLAYNTLLKARSIAKIFFAEFFQGAVYPETSLRRALLLNRTKTDEIVLMGDDDLLSIALGLLGFKVTVFDIDKILVQTLNLFAKEWNLPVTAYVQDLRKPISGAFKNRYDVCFTDPGPGIWGYKIFLFRAISCLKSNGTIYLSGTSAVSKRVIEELKLKIEEVHKDFNHYLTPLFSHSPFRSSLYILAKTEKTEVSYPLNMEIDVDLEALGERHFLAEYVLDMQGCNLDKMELKQIFSFIDDISKERIIDVKTRSAISQNGDLICYALLRDNSLLIIQTLPERRYVGISIYPAKQSEMEKVMKRAVEFFSPVEKGVGMTARCRLISDEEEAMLPVFPEMY